MNRPTADHVKRPPATGLPRCETAYLICKGAVM